MKFQFVLAFFTLAMTAQAGGGGGGAPARRSLGVTQLPREWMGTPVSNEAHKSSNEKMIDPDADMDVPVVESE
ncbi:uncharacterized protein BDW43DRAFT_314782 [Aspergillus alliaceus]|uniref:uncharacterized protein n=1 Tax=Petromyces alliaceus TaxID=209559 RepID=UPI0012A4B10D|nr:uncharacterized protein BDW43DRAFT_314782 [Aspergillus alliaceus]KAB8229581.1 hypothetical protein BDW43DRAFT_314782 [Aspergillus alliaceus]